MYPPQTKRLNRVTVNRREILSNMKLTIVALIMVVFGTVLNFLIKNWKFNEELK